MTTLYIDLGTNNELKISPIRKPDKKVYYNFYYNKPDSNLGFENNQSDGQIFFQNHDIFLNDITANIKGTKEYWTNIFYFDMVKYIKFKVSLFSYETIPIKTIVYGRDKKFILYGFIGFIEGGYANYGTYKENDNTNYYLEISQDNNVKPKIDKYNNLPLKLFSNESIHTYGKKLNNYKSYSENDYKYYFESIENMKSYLLRVASVELSSR